MNTRHTPGPWTVQHLEGCYHDYDDWDTFCVRAPNNCHLATVGEVDRFYSANARANAQLIAAAPELLKALRNTVRLLELLNRPGANDPVEAAVYAARAAIAKATNTTPL